MSRYHRFKQHDGRGYGILVLDENDAGQATVLQADMTDEKSLEQLEVLRSFERGIA